MKNYLASRGYDKLRVSPAAKELANALAQVLSNPREAEQLASAAARRAEDFTLAKMTERYVALYASLFSCD